MPYRRAVAATWRGACKLSRTIELLVFGPAPPPARVHHLKPFDLGTAPITVSQQHASFSKAAFTGLHRLSITQNFCSDHGAQRDIGDLLLVSLILWLMRDRPAESVWRPTGRPRPRIRSSRPRPPPTGPVATAFGALRIVAHQVGAAVAAYGTDLTRKTSTRRLS